MLGLILFSLCLLQEAAAPVDPLLQTLATAQGPDRIKPLLALVEALAGEDEPQALEYAQEAQTLLHLYPNRDDRISLLQDICWIYARLGEFDKAHAVVAEHLEMTSIMKGHAYGVALRDKGTLLLYGDRFEEALEYLTRAEIYLEPNTLESATAQSNLGVIYRHLGDNHKALEFYLQSLKSFESLEIYDRQAVCLNNIGTVYRNLNRHAKALVYYQRSLVLKEKYTPPSMVATTLHNMGITYYRMEDFEQARIHHQRALELRESVGNPKTMAASLLQLGLVATALNQPETAKAHIGQCIQIRREKGSADSLAEALTAMASIFENNGNATAAMPFLEEAYALLPKISDNHRAHEFFETLSRIHAKMGNFESAYQAHLRYSELDNLLYNEETTEAVARMERRYNLAQRQREIEQLQRQNQLVEMDLKRQETLGWAMGLGLSGFFLLILLAYSRFESKRKLEQERLVNEQLRQLDRLKDEFLANTSHELRTPLNGIIGLAESLHDGAAGPVSTDVQSNLALVISSGKRLASLVNNLLDFSKMNHGHLQLKCAPVDLYAVTDVVLALSKPLVQHKPVTLINQVPHNLPTALADENRLLQILHNLVGNACKYTLSGLITVQAEIHEDHLQVTISDTGVGIPEDRFESVFNSFEQVDGTVTRAAGGTGLGLTVTRDLVALHKGRIWLESKLDEGSHFHFTLPLANSPARKKNGVVPAPTTIQEPTPVAREQHIDKDAFTILIVDDDPINRRVLFNHLSLHNYRLMEADSGSAVLELMEHQSFDLILLDVMMPVMSGFELCGLIRQQHAPNELPIIFLTARARAEDLPAGFEAGANDFLTKPIAKQELLTRLKLHLSLLHTNRNLEQLVTTRTKDLERANQQLRQVQKRLTASAHRAGMAEIAVNVLHNVGNSLNTINASNQVLLDSVHEPKSMRMLEQLVEMLRGKREDLAAFLMDDDKGKLVPEALSRIHNHQQKILNSLTHEIQHIQMGIDQIRDVLDAQQQYTHGAALSEDLNPVELVKEILALETDQLQQHQITTDLQAPVEMAMVRVDRFKLTAVLTQLIAGTVQALSEVNDQRELCIGFQRNADQIQIQFSDNGPAIPTNLRQRIFAQGVSPDENGSGFGLHYCANTLQEMGGSITLKDADQGRCFLLALPLAPS